MYGQKARYCDNALQSGEQIFSLLYNLQVSLKAKTLAWQRVLRVGDRPV
ncbi:MAG: hypothetical protein AAFX78_12790 [Cyanobacteria bacterium J06638_20]